MFLVAVFDIFRLSAIVPLIDRIFTDKPIILFKDKWLPFLLENLVNYLNALAPKKVLFLLLAVMPVAVIIRAIFEFFHSYIMSDVGQKVIRNVRNSVYEKIQHLSLEYFAKKRSGELVSRITNDVKLIENAVSYALTDLVYQSFEIMFFSLTIFWINWRLASISILVLPLVAIPMVKVGQVLRRLSKKSQEKMADINSLLIETFSGVRIVKAFCAEEREIGKFARQNQDYYKIAMKSIKRMTLLGIGTELIGVAMALFMAYYGATLVFKNLLSFGVFALFMACLLSLIRPFKKLSQVNSIMQQALTASMRIYEILETKPTVVEKVTTKILPEFKDKIVFEDVWFSYENQDILKGINLEVKRDEVLAIVGPSGVGKTTLVDLIPRLYDPKKGRILIDAVDIKELSFKSLRQHIGMVTQETILFNDTIRANIAYGKPEASEKDIEQAAIQAYAYDFIKQLPQGFQTIIGDRGMKLSGGERQRIAIARALLKNPPILVLDEATSQLDSESERIVQEALDKLIYGRTVFVIAHRLSTVKGAHKIIVLDKGRIVEEGSHNDLLNKGAFYKRLYQMQELQ